MNMKLYLVEDIDYCWRFIVQANNGDEAIEKLHKWCDDTNRNNENFSSRKINWLVDIFDYDKIIK